MGSHYGWHDDIKHHTVRQRFAQVGIAVGVVLLVLQVFIFANQLGIDLDLGRLLDVDQVQQLGVLVPLIAGFLTLGHQAVATVVAAGHSRPAGALPAPAPFPLPAPAGRIVSPATPPPRFSPA